MEVNKLVCPECGVVMDDIDPIAHALTHWPDYLDPAKSSKLAKERQAKTRKGGVSEVEYKKEHVEVK
jgi:hypothetical protein